MIPYLEIPSLHLFGPLEVHVFGRLLTLGPVDIHAFGVLVAIGILVGAGRTRYRARQLGLSDVETASMITWVVVIGFVVAHLFAVVAYQPDRLRELDFGGKVSLLLDPRRGLSSFGGFLGALIALLVFSRNNRYPLFPAADSLLFGLIYGWLFGRLGCYSAHDHPGRFTDFFLAVPYPEGTRHDLGFDEALGVEQVAVGPRAGAVLGGTEEDHGTRRSHQQDPLGTGGPMAPGVRPLTVHLEPVRSVLGRADPQPPRREGSDERLDHRRLAHTRRADERDDERADRHRS